MSTDTTSQHALFIANPGSGGGTLGRRWSQISAVLCAEYGPFHHRLTQSPGHASELATQALQAGYRLIVAVGGDGTINEVVNGLMASDATQRAQAALGVLHFGTGGDFCRSARYPKKLRAAARALRGERTRPIDVGRLRYVAREGGEAVRHFINIASFGISGLVDQLVNDSSKALGGRLSFASATIRAMRRYRAQRVNLRLDNHPWHQVSLHNVAVANGQYFGGGMRIAPNAELDDGQFDVITLAPMSTLDVLRLGHRVYGGRHLDLPQVTASRAARVEAVPVDPHERVLLDVDGETPGWLPATFELLPRALNLRLPER